ncbi:MAG: M16 family metallopeptidase [Candidatus Eisenbacteria bacterium]
MLDRRISPPVSPPVSLRISPPVSLRISPPSLISLISLFACRLRPLAAPLAVLLACLLGALVPAGFAAAGSVAAGDRFPYTIQTVKLDNGLLLVMVPMASPGVVHYQTVVRAGSRNEIEPGRTGYAHFFEHVMFRGTKRFPQAEYQRLLDVLGADGNASTGMDETNYFNTLPASGLDQVIEIEADRFRNLSYTEEQFRKEAGAVLGEFAIGHANVETLLEERLLAHAFPRHPYGHTVLGTEADVRAMPDGYQYSRQFYDRYYRPENCAILICGDFDPTRAADAVRAAYGGWERGGYGTEIPVERPLASAIRDSIRWNGPTRPILQISFRTPAYATSVPTAAALELLREAVFGPTSKLYRELVLDRRLAESLSASAGRNRDPYLFTVSVRLYDDGQLEPVRARILAALQEASAPAGIDGAVLEAAKRRYLAQLALSLETPAGVAWRLSDWIGLTGDPQEIERFVDALRASDPSQLRRAASQFLLEKNSITITVTGKEVRS